VPPFNEATLTRPQSSGLLSGEGADEAVLPGDCDEAGGDDCPGDCDGVSEGVPQPANVEARSKTANSIATQDLLIFTFYFTFIVIYLGNCEIPFLADGQWPPLRHVEIISALDTICRGAHCASGSFAIAYL